MKKQSLLKTTALSAVLYFLLVVVAVLIDLFVLKVANMAHTPALTALLAGGVYLGLVEKTQRFGPIFSLGLMMSIFFFFSGHFVWAFLPNLLAGLVAEAVAKSGNYKNKARNILSYAVFSLGNLAPIITMWVAPKAYAAQLLAEGKDQAYIDLVMIPATVGEISAQIIGTVACAVIGALLVQFLMKKTNP